jgi:hypothetical protein
MLGAAAGLGLLLPGNGLAQEMSPPAPQLQQQKLAAVSAANEQQEDSPACFLPVASELSAAPDLVTDADVEAASSQMCSSLEATLVNGLGWVVEEAQEVTNFTENNFAAVG